MKWLWQNWEVKLDDLYENKRQDEEWLIRGSVKHQLSSKIQDDK